MMLPRVYPKTTWPSSSGFGALTTGLWKEERKRAAGDAEIAEVGLVWGDLMEDGPALSALFWDRRAAVAFWSSSRYACL